jgi:hypothetical protein
MQEARVGLDFITQKGKAFHKMWDGGRTALATADLLDGEAEWDEQHVLFDVHRGIKLGVGDHLVVQVDGAALVALRGQDVVATASAPPAGILAAVTTAGYALARVARYSDVSNTADLAFRVR